jgi:hypothetical protein
MKKLLAFLTLVLTVSLSLTPLAHAEERIGVQFSNENLYLKSGSVTSPWNQIASGVSIFEYDLAGDYISVINSGGGNPWTAMLKQPSWNSPWNYLHLNNAGHVYMTKTSNGQYRIVIVQTDGSVVMKDGAWNSGYWSGTIVPSGASSVVLGTDNVGVRMTNGDFKVKRLVPGQFSHPNNVEWQLVATNVDSAAMSDTRIAVAQSHLVWAKEGGITAPWNQAPIFDAANLVRLAGDRLCAIRTDSKVECKEGSLSSEPKFTADNILGFELSKTRFLALHNYSGGGGGTVDVMEGSLNQNSGWRTIATGAIAIELNPLP